ncbi:MAG: glycine cleavage system protein GcvH [Limisphaerales bacterium]|jgi:glycine cleavage system H protein|nr:glycine cleavage system protein GcvH [Verrucomicrobiota bacterium]
MSKIKFLKSHEWYNPESNTVGISDFAQRELGDIVFVELPQVGESVEAGEAFGNVESVKAVSEIYSPVSGTIIEINEELESAPELINQDANAAWMIKVEVSAVSEELISAEEYDALTKK